MKKNSPAVVTGGIRQRAEAKLAARPGGQSARAGGPKSASDTQRLFHELQVHEIELELQNVELRGVRDELEVALANYTDLYDFTPAGYFTLAPTGVIQQVNLFGANLVGIERSRLVGKAFGRLLAAGARAAFDAFLKEVFSSQVKRLLDVELPTPQQPLQIVRLRAQRSLTGLECRVVIVDITELKREENKVRVSEMRYRRLFETAHDGVVLLDPVTRKITDANPFMTQLLGYPHAELIGKELFEIGLLKDVAASREMFEQLKRQHEVRYEDLPLETKGGLLTEVEVVANLYQEGGHAVIQCNIRDITARKLTEHELAEKARLLDLSHDAIIVRDMAGHIRYWNHGAEELYGWSRAEVIGKISHLLLKTKFPMPLKEMVKELHRTDRWIGELIHTSRTGRRITALARKTLDRDSRGKPVAVLENITDITARKQGEEALTASEERFRAAVGVVTSLIWTNSAEGLMVGEQPGWGNFTGQTQKEYQGYGWAKALHPKDAPPTLAAWKKAVAKKSLFEFEHRVRRHDGAWRLCSVRAVPLLGSGGVIREWVGVHTDITERKAAEAAQRRIEVLAASNEKLEAEIIRRQAVETALQKSERHERQLRELAQRMQQELRQLSQDILQTQEEERKRISRELHDVIAQTLTGINLRLASLKTKAGQSRADFERNLMDTQKVISKSVDVVHEFARELRPAMLDDLGLIPALHSYLKNFTAQHGVRTHLTAFAGVEKLAIAQRTVLFRVAQEALTNVARHARASRVEVNIAKTVSGLSLLVKDNGQAFDAVRVLHAKGQGRLGLLGMRERLEMVGGTFEITSVPGQGTTVRAEIPLATTRTVTLKKTGKAKNSKPGRGVRPIAVSGNNP